MAIRIRKTQLSEKDRRKALKTAVRKAFRESGLDRLTMQKSYRNRKKYNRKNRQKLIKRDQDAG